MTPTITWCIVSDESGHDYLIKSDQESDFREWVDYMEGAHDEVQYGDTDFEVFRLNGPVEFTLPANLTFMRDAKTDSISFE